jgi:uncharacterized membrane protein YqgA involved in biofilm formation
VLTHHEAADWLDILKSTLDGISLGIVFTTIMGWMPSAAALLTVIWTLIRIWESRTVQEIRNRRK